MGLTLNYQTTPANTGQSLSDFLSAQHLSRKAIIALKHRGGKIMVNDAEKTTRYQLRSKDVVTVIFADEPVSRTLLPIEMALNIVFEDDFLLIIEKSAGLPVIPTGVHDVGLANGVLAYYQKIDLNSTVHFVNRLDKDTSGLLMVAKYRHIHHLMTKEQDTIVRKYYALTDGMLNESCQIDAPIFRPSVASIKRIVDERGKSAITNVEVLKHIENQTLVKCSLETGRTHQIRVHLAYLGVPISKDSLYGNGSATDQQLLHSYFLAFKHPISGKNLTFQTEIPERFSKI